jgi:hypothetical protein
MITDFKNYLRGHYNDNTPVTGRGDSLRMCMWSGVEGSDGKPSNKIDTKEEWPKQAETLFKGFGDDNWLNRQDNGGTYLANYFPEKLTAAELMGKGFSTPKIAEAKDGAISMFYGNCLGEAGFSLFNPRLGIAGSIVNFNPLFHKITGYLRKLQDCRADMYGVARLTLAQFRNSWEGWSGDRLLQQLSFDAAGGDTATDVPKRMHGVMDWLFHEDTDWSRRLLRGIAPAATTDDRNEALEGLVEWAANAFVTLQAPESALVRKLAEGGSDSSSDSSSDRKEEDSGESAFKTIFQMTNW